MVERRLRSRSKRKVFVKTPGGVTVKHYRDKKPAKPTCSGCGTVLAGVIRGKSSVIAKFAKTKRRPERPYGGVLCSRCSRKKIIERMVKNE